jgi:phosphoglycerate dehydrogenase-like enzyme
LFSPGACQPTAKHNGALRRLQGEQGKLQRGCASTGSEHEILLSKPEVNGWNGWMIVDKPIGVAGAGSIGCFVGGMYAAAGRRVALLARPRLIEEIEANQIRP